MPKAKRKAPTTQQRTGGGARTVNVPISPSAASVQTRRESPFTPLQGGGFWQSVGANLAGVAAVAILVSVLPANNKWVGALLGGGAGGVATMTSPVGTWISEAGSGALASGATYGMLAVINRSNAQNTQ